MNETNNQLWAKGDLIGGRYEVLKVMKGGMGIVYVVKDHNYSSETGLPEVLIAKCLRPDLAVIQSLRMRFKQEAALWLQLKPYRNVVRAYYVESIFDTPYIFADYVEPGYLPNTLAEWIYRKITPPEVALCLLFQIIDGLWDTSFDNIALHGDLKPSNILIDKTCTVKVTDWGLSHATETEIEEFKRKGPYNNSESGSQITFSNHGTPGYAAPELSSNKLQPTRAVDIFSLGVIFGEMLTGRIFPKDASIQRVEETLRFCFALDSETRLVFAKIISEFVGSDPELRMKNYKENISLLVQTFKRMTGLRMRPPRDDSYVHDPIRAERIASSMRELDISVKKIRAFGEKILSVEYSNNKGED